MPPLPPLRLRLWQRRSLADVERRHGDLRAAAKRKYQTLGRRSLALQRRGDFGGKIRLFLLDPLAQREAREARDMERGAGLFRRRLNHLGHLALAVDDIELLQQHHVLVEFLEAAFDHLVDYGVGLARGLGLLALPAAFALKPVASLGNGSFISLSCLSASRAGSSWSWPGG